MVVTSLCVQLMVRSVFRPTESAPASDTHCVSCLINQRVLDRDSSAALSVSGALMLVHSWSSWSCHHRPSQRRPSFTKAEDESFHRRRRVCKNMDVIKPLPVNWSGTAHPDAASMFLLPDSQTDRGHWDCPRVDTCEVGCRLIV